MKARFLALAALVLGLASCQTEPEGLNVNVGGEVDTTVCVSLPEATRANSAEGAFANLNLEGDDNLTVRYIFEVYYGNTGVQKQVYYTDEKTASFPVRLVPGRDYNFVAWADIVPEANVTEMGKALPYEDTDVYYETSDLTNITIIDSNNEWKAMDETRDAYTGFYNTASEGDNNKYTGTSSINIQMTRPFAKLRVITTDMVELTNLGIIPTSATVKYNTNTNHYQSFNAVAGKVVDTSKTIVEKTHTFNYADVTAYESTNANKVLFTDYFFATDKQEVVNFSLDVCDQGGNPIGETTNFTTPIPAQRNYLTTIQGNILTDGNDIKVTVDNVFANAGNLEDAPYYNEVVEVNSASELKEAIEAVNNSTTNEQTIIVIGQDIDLNDLFAQTQAVTRAATPKPILEIKAGKSLTFDLNGKTLSGKTFGNANPQDLFLVKGNLTVKNGTITAEHVGENMGWGGQGTIFNITAGGVVNLDTVTAKYLGGTDMGFVAHLNNWGEVTLNVDNCTLESNYVAVRVFNSGPDMNNVTIKNSTLKGVSAAFWVHNYTEADFANTNTTAEKQKALLNLNIYKQGNTFNPDVNGIRYGFTNSVRTDAYGITKAVSEDGTVVTLGTIFENNTIRRGVAGEEENTTIKKVVVEEGIAVLYDRTFRRFYALEEVVLPSTLTTIGAAGSGVFQSCTNLKSIVIPESVTVLGKGSFQECSSLESINIPAGVTRIEENALRATGLVSVEFHAGVTYFGAQAFRDCKQLTEVVINAPEFTMENNTFGIMAAPFTPMTIYVANNEMKTYVESKLTDHAKTYITVKAPAVVTDKASLQTAMADAIKKGEKNIFIDGTNFSGDLNYGFSNTNLPAGVTVTIRNAKVTATSKWNYLNGKLVFENCEFTAGLYSIHFDDNDGVGDVVFKNCKLVGWLPFSAINSVTFEGCHLTGNGSYALIRSYADLTLKDCVIDTTLANHTDQYSDGVEAIDATLTEENVTYIDNHTAYLQNVLKAGKHVVLSSDLTINENEMMTAPYGNKMALHHNGGLFDGNNKTLSVTIGGDHYAVMTSGGTIKDLTVNNGFRGVLIMSPKETIYLDKVVSSGEGVCYALNTAEGDSTQDLVATNCTFNGWCSWSLLKSATFTNCTFGQGTYYTNVYGRLGRPYVNTVFDGCDFCSKYYIDLSALVADQKVIVKNCTVNGVKITAENWTSLVAPEDTCGEGQISVELKNGTFLTAENVVDYIVFE